MNGRLWRTTAWVCVALALVAAVVWRDWRVAGGVLGGGVVMGMSVWSLAGLVTGLTVRDEAGGERAVPRAVALVKFFTRHAILAIAAYVMMVRLHLDPVGMIVGVTSVVVAAAFEAVRPR